MFNQLSFLHREIVMRIKGTATNLIMRHTQYTTNPVYDKPHKLSLIITYNCGMVGYEEEADAAGGED